jgi:hypothetical protein
MSSYLGKLVGKTVTHTEMGTSTTYAIGRTHDNPDFAKTEIELSIFFEDYYLNIYNSVTLFPSDKELLDFIGLKVIAISDAKKEAELVFDNGSKIVIDLTYEEFYGPEAMTLSGPDNFLAIWN